MVNKKKSAENALLTSLLLGVLGGYIGAHAAYLITTYRGGYLQGLSTVLSSPQIILSSILSTPIPPANDQVTFGAIALFALVFIVSLKFMSASQYNYRRGEEGGSAKWGSFARVRRFANRKHFSENIILSKRIKLAFKKRGRSAVEYARNLNVFVVGGSGSGKTEFVIKPNILNLIHKCNIFVNDPKGTVLKSVGRFLKLFGVAIRQFNTVSFDRSSKYNPFTYVKDDPDLLLFIDNFMSNTNPGDGQNSADPFWDKSERMFYMSLCALMRDWLDIKDYNVPTLLKLASWAKVKDGEQSRLDLIFKQIEDGVKYIDPRSGKVADKPVAIRHGRSLEEADDWDWVPTSLVRRDGKQPGKINPLTGKRGLASSEDIALSCWQAYRDAPEKTRDCILVCAQSRLKPLEIPEVQELLSDDEMNLYDLTDPKKKVAVFCTSSDVNSTFSFLSAILISQTIEILNQTADLKYGGKLPKPVGLFIDELPNQFINGLERVVATCRSRNFFLALFAQSVAQMEVTYEKNTETIFDCCDSFVYLGGKSTETNERVSKMIGKETYFKTTTSFDKDGNASKSVSPESRDLIDPAELGKMSKKKCIVMISGTDSYMDFKFCPWQHKNHKYIESKAYPGAAPQWYWRGVRPLKHKPHFDTDFCYVEYRQELIAQENTSGKEEKVYARAA